MSTEINSHTIFDNYYDKLICNLDYDNLDIIIYIMFHRKVYVNPHGSERYPIRIVMHSNYDSLVINTNLNYQRIKLDHRFY